MIAHLNVKTNTHSVIQHRAIPDGVPDLQRRVQHDRSASHDHLPKQSRLLQHVHHTAHDQSPNLSHVPRAAAPRTLTESRPRRSVGRDCARRRLRWCCACTSACAGACACAGASARASAGASARASAANTDPTNQLPVCWLAVSACDRRLAVRAATAVGDRLNNRRGGPRKAGGVTTC